ncbi:MAG: DUF1684 domain-containing protein [Flavobacteriaceae bacterium]
MIRLFVICIVVFLMSCNQERRPLLGETDYQKEQNAKFKDATTSPLTDKDRKNFRGLDFFKFDSTYIVKASLKRTPNAEWFSMKTTTERLSKERVFGILTFEISGERYNLNVYQGEENMQTKGLEDYLFLPFLDDTNGDQSYDGGRYIDLRISESDTITIDFNRAYNPLCVYNEKFSCPLVPRENYLPIQIKAGVKMYAKH